MRSPILNYVWDAIEQRAESRIEKKARERERKLNPSDFTIRYMWESGFYGPILALMITTVGFIFHLFEAEADLIRMIHILSVIVWVGAVVLVVINLTYRCHVDTVKLEQFVFGCFTKTVLWEDVADVKLKSDRNELTLLLFDKNGKKLLDFSPEQVGFGTLCALIKEQDKTIKSIKRDEEAEVKAAVRAPLKKDRKHDE